MMVGLSLRIPTFLFLPYIGSKPPSFAQATIILYYYYYYIIIIIIVLEIPIIVFFISREREKRVLRVLLSSYLTSKPNTIHNNIKHTLSGQNNILNISSIQLDSYKQLLIFYTAYKY